MPTPYSTTMSRSIAASASPTSTPTPWPKLGPELPGMRSRMAPNARLPLVPMACTPETSRHALPAIFCTTPSATEMLPVIGGQPIPPLTVGGAGLAAARGNGGLLAASWLLRVGSSDMLPRMPFS